MQDKTTCDACAVLEADLVGLDQRVQALEHSCNRMKEAFVKNDLGLPDYDGHRTDHKVRIEESQIVAGYKRDATKTILGWILAAVAGMFSVGFFDWFKGHLK